MREEDHDGRPKSELEITDGKLSSVNYVTQKKSPFYLVSMPGGV